MRSSTLLLLLGAISCEACERQVSCQEMMTYYNIVVSTSDACSRETFCADKVELFDASGQMLSSLSGTNVCSRAIAGKLPVGDYSVKTFKAGYWDQTTPFPVREDECGEWTTPWKIHVGMMPIDGCPQK